MSKLIGNCNHIRLQGPSLCATRHGRLYSRDIIELEAKMRRQELTLGGDHPQLVDALSQLAHLYFVFGRYNEVETLLWRAVTICSKWFGHEHISVAGLLSDLGYLYEAQEHWPEAEHVYRLAYSIKTGHFGRTHREPMQLARSIVRVCRSQDKHLPELELEQLARVAV